jgi:hypothetical protein
VGTLSGSVPEMNSIVRPMHSVDLRDELFNPVPEIPMIHAPLDGAVLLPEVEILFSSDSDYGDIKYMKCFVDLSMPLGLQVLPFNNMLRHRHTQIDKAFHILDIAIVAMHYAPLPGPELRAATPVCAALRDGGPSVRIDVGGPRGV